jgi:hypothetical protein
MKKIFLIAILLILQIQVLWAQEEIEIQNVISMLFEGMKDKKPEMFRQVFHPDASMQTVIAGEDGASLGSDSVEDFVNGIAATPSETILEERILDYQIKIDGEMASVWTPYEFFVNGNFSHCGVNSFQMIKTPAGWKITYVIDTRRKTGC